MAAYSIDLRQKIVHAYERRLGSQCAIADLFGVSVSFVEKLWRRYRTAGDIAPKPHAGGQRPRLALQAQTLVRGVLHGNPDATLGELCASVATATGARVSVATMCRLLQHLGLPRKKSHSTPQSATRSPSSRRGRPTAN
ncbi:MAG: helix-turn-helix domain-containing protein [Candidatus Tectomicrobia bacterium]|nr:helix-turn-helix domain-containing protein [Candidatus Tectomicrobia bacterium]